MKDLLIGSRALEFWKDQNNGFKARVDSDWDVISAEPIEGTEWHAPDVCSNWLMEDLASDHKVSLPCGKEVFVMSMEGLAIIKRSHLWRDIGFSKHITMYHKHGLADVAKKLQPLQVDLLNRRIQVTMQEFPQRHPSLNKTVEDFFDDYVEKKYNHDWLHEQVAFYDAPLYTKMQRDPSKAWCEKDLWDEFSHQEKVKCVAEETLVISIERFLVPKDWDFPAKLAYLKSLHKVCTTLCSGWFRCFAIDNYPEVVQQFDEQIFKRVQAQIQTLQ